MVRLLLLLLAGGILLLLLLVACCMSVRLGACCVRCCPVCTRQLCCGPAAATKIIKLYTTRPQASGVVAWL